MSNREQVLALPELLENILLQLPTRDILFAQKVCKEWQEAIAASPKIQEALCFRQERATNGPSVKDATAGTKLAITANPLLLTTYAYYDEGAGKVKECFLMSAQGALHQHILIRQHTIMATAQKQALGVAEILEAILLQLPPHDLLFAQKVCKDWKHTIEASPSIQKALFFMPGTKDDVHPVYATAERLSKSFRIGEAVAPNPLLTICYYSCNISWLPSHEVYVNLLHMSEEASCHRMFITLPPTNPSFTFRIDTRDGRFCASRLSPLYSEPMGFDRFGALAKYFWGRTGAVEPSQNLLEGGEVSLEKLRALGRQTSE
ncbi:hypothetical protein LTR15_006460 [Elasticomyces elasticus]|nr:hypothetical protein LTR15_006460 [Elasticomyces elasticus]